MIDPQQARLLLVASLAGTRAGYRLGCGGGYSDRLVAAPGLAPTLGACFQAHLLDSIPRPAQDRPVGYVVTDGEGALAAQRDRQGAG